MLERDIPKSEAALTRLAEIWESQMGENAAILPGAGAAGGLGFGLHCFAGASISSGFKIFAEATDLKSKLAENDIVITGEGALDRQTSMGKGVGELAKLAHKNNTTLKEEALKSGYVDEVEFDSLVDPKKMI